MEIYLNQEKFTKHECQHAEQIFESCVEDALRDRQSLCENGLEHQVDSFEDYIINSFVKTWLEETNDCSLEKELLATKRAYSAFNYANQILGALGAVHMLVDSFNIEPPPDTVMDELEKALDKNIVFLELRPISLSVKKTAFTM